MSRYTIKFEGGKEFIYGHDHVLGYFYEILDYNKGNEPSEYVICENSTTLGRMSKKEMISLMKQNRANPDHIDMVNKELPF